MTIAHLASVLDLGGRSIPSSATVSTAMLVDAESVAAAFGTSAVELAVAGPDATATAAAGRSEVLSPPPPPSLLTLLDGPQAASRNAPIEMATM